MRLPLSRFAGEGDYPQGVSVGVLRGAGFLVSAGYAVFLVWLYVARPESLAEVKGGMASTVGLYAIDIPRFEEGKRLFAADRFPEARVAFERADPAHRDPVTQYYILQLLPPGLGAALQR